MKWLLDIFTKKKILKESTTNMSYKDRLKSKYL